MSLDLVPRQWWRLPSIWDDEEDANLAGFASGSGVSISEDDKHVYVGVAVPGVDEKNIDITFDKGVLWVKGEAVDEEKSGRKYYRKSASSFSYRISVPGDIDNTHDPVADYKHGIMTVTFTKSAQSQPKKITLKSSK